MTTNFQPPTRKSLPILMLKGSYYEVGYEIGRTFASRISKLTKSTQAELESSPGYDPEFADNIFANAAKIVQINFPQLWEEMWGMADGAQVDLRQIFTLQLAEVLHYHSKQNIKLAETIIEEVDEGEEESDKTEDPQENEETERNQESEDFVRGCSDILMNLSGQVAIAHTEDLAANLLDECYVTRVHYIDSSTHPRGKLRVTEEFITAYLYPGDLPGFTMAASGNFALSVNDLSSSEVDPWGTPKGILARAAMTCSTIEEIVTMMTDAGHGIAAGISMNIMMLNEEPRRLFNIEVACREGAERNHGGMHHAVIHAEADMDLPPRQSRISVHEVALGEVYFHCNLFRRVGVTPKPGTSIGSEHRMAVMTQNHPVPETLEDLKRILSDESDEDYPVFREKSAVDLGKTAAIGIFDGSNGKWRIFTDRATKDDTMSFSLPLHGGLQDS